MNTFLDYKKQTLEKYDKFKSAGVIDSGIIELCDLINSFDFIVTTDSCEGHIPVDQERCLTCHRITNYSAYILAKIDNNYLCNFVLNMKDLANFISISYFGLPANGGEMGMKVGFYIPLNRISINEASKKIETFLKEIK